MSLSPFRNKVAFVDGEWRMMLTRDPSCDTPDALLARGILVRRRKARFERRNPNKRYVDTDLFVRHTAACSLPACSLIST